MKKRISALLLAALPLLWPAGASAQDYTVFSVRGNVRATVGKQCKEVKPRLELSGSSRVTIPNAGKLVLLAKKGNKLYTISKPCCGTLSALLADTQRSTVKELSDTYRNYLLKHLSGKGLLETQTAYMDKTASAYRGDSTEVDAWPADSVISIENAE